MLFLDLVEAPQDDLGELDVLVEGNGLEPCPLDLSLGDSDRVLDRVVVWGVGGIEHPFELEPPHDFFDLSRPMDTQLVHEKSYLLEGELASQGP